MLRKEIALSRAPSRTQEMGRSSFLLLWWLLLCPAPGARVGLVARPRWGRRRWALLTPRPTPGRRSDL